ncbi:NB-ARC domains-containing protein, partial [Tanacetum coccineum]
DATPKLEKLFVSDMENLKEIWPPQFYISKLCLLRELTVKGCGSIDVLFNMDFCEIEQISSSLRSIEVKRLLFNSDLGRAGKSEELVCSSSLRSIEVSGCHSLCPLRELGVCDCDSIEVLFNMDFGEIKQISSSLRSIKVDGCKSLVKLFSCNPFPFLNSLQELTVSSCGSIQVLFDTDLGRAGKSVEQFLNVLFDIDMGCVGETDKVSSSRLRSILLVGLGKLREVWRIKDGGNNLIHGFEAVENIKDCERFENIITPATTNFDMRALKKVRIIDCGGEIMCGSELDVLLLPTPPSSRHSSLSNPTTMSSAMHQYDELAEGRVRDKAIASNLQELRYSSCDSMKVLVTEKKNVMHRECNLWCSLDQVLKSCEFESSGGILLRKEVLNFYIGY